MKAFSPIVALVELSHTPPQPVCGNGSSDVQFPLFNLAEPKDLSLQSLVGGGTVKKKRNLDFVTCITHIKTILSFSISNYK